MAAAMNSEPQLRIPDHVEAIRWLTRSAEAGHGGAQLALGCLWSYGFEGSAPNHRNSGHSVHQCLVPD